MAASEQELHNLLESHNSRKYDIEYNGYRSNHLPHGIIALYRLGASKERLEKFIQWYTPRLANPEKSIDNDTVDISNDAILGKRVHYYSILANYERKLSSEYKNLEELIDAEFPNLALGLSGSLFHGLIHLGYGYSVRSSKIAREGLAYLHHSYRPIQMTGGLRDVSLFGKGQRNILSVLEEVRENQDLFNTMMKEGDTKEFMDLNVSHFQRRLGYLCKYKGDYLVSLMQSVSLPENLRKPNSQEYDVKRLGQWTVELAAKMYTMSSRKNDFVLIHGVTSAWSLLQVLPVLKSYQDQLDAVRVFLCCLIGTYFANGAHQLNRPIDHDSADADWDGLVKRTLDPDVDNDEHIYKLVQVCTEMKSLSKENEALYYQAANSALQNDIFIF